MESFKKADVNIHMIATGAGAGLQHMLWATPGCSAYFSGAEFPYDQDEQEELLGFRPEHFCSEEAAIDLASAAYMKAYKFGGKKAIGLGLTASVTSNKLHRGDHRVFGCVITDDKVLTISKVLEKESEYSNVVQRHLDGDIVDVLGLHLLYVAIGNGDEEYVARGMETVDATELAKARFFERPFFTANGKRLGNIPYADKEYKPYALMSGAFNPPHEGHFGTAEQVLLEKRKSVIFEITAEPPHKASLTVQELLQRSKLLHGRDRIFTKKMPYYIDKAKAFPGMALVLGSDSMVRMLDPKWGIDPYEMFDEFLDLGTQLFVVGRNINGKFIDHNAIYDGIAMFDRDLSLIYDASTSGIGGQWDISSTELRNKLL